MLTYSPLLSVLDIDDALRSGGVDLVEVYQSCGGLDASETERVDGDGRLGVHEPGDDLLGTSGVCECLCAGVGVLDAMASE